MSQHSDRNVDDLLQQRQQQQLIANKRAHNLRENTENGDTTDDFKASPSVSSTKRLKTNNENDSQDEDNHKTCQICFETFANSGPHRITSVTCGHLFGESCILSWINKREHTTSTGKVPAKCPLCNTPVRKTHLRPVFVSKVMVEDTTRIEELKAENSQLKSDLARLRHLYDEEKLSANQQRVWFRKEREQFEEREKAYKKQIQRLQRGDAIDSNEDAEGAIKKAMQFASFFCKPLNYRIPSDYKVRPYEFDAIYGSAQQMYLAQISGRALALNARQDMLVASVSQSQTSASATASGHGLQKISLTDTDQCDFIWNHTKVIRDIQCSPFADANVLSTGLSKEMKLTCIHSKCDIVSYPLGNQGWSCAFDNRNNNLVYCGLANDTLNVFDARFTKNVLARLKGPSDCPLHSIAVVSHPHDGQKYILCSNRARSYLWEWHGPEDSVLKTLPDQGHGYKPYSLSYNEQTQSVLVSSRGQDVSRHAIYSLNNLQEHVWSVDSKGPQVPLARTCHYSYDASQDPADATICFSDHDSLSLWNRAGRVQSIPTGGMVLDVKSTKLASGPVLAALGNDQRLHLFNYL
ncbi:hypothetical protein BCR43DRAFT_524676 [Syncephalastrum racemosum]|uniref:RING-type domain-containing protein n=1 Tax=Syncephalastrum racemosum TaxID=13706 RepID=A0A1X2HCV4_SYNRA|nr:hypothetical protein BCR43DRAFT_524676 [Syncephalastrum racemosum]